MFLCFFVWCFVIWVLLNGCLFRFTVDTVVWFGECVFVSFVFVCLWWLGVCYLIMFVALVVYGVRSLFWLAIWFNLAFWCFCFVWWEWFCVWFWCLFGFCCWCLVGFGIWLFASVFGFCVVWVILVNVYCLVFRVGEIVVFIIDNCDVCLILGFDFRVYFVNLFWVGFWNCLI